MDDADDDDNEGDAAGDDAGYDDGKWHPSNLDCAHLGRPAGGAPSNLIMENLIVENARKAHGFTDHGDACRTVLFEPSQSG